MKCMCPGYNLILGLLCSQTVGDSNDYICYSYRTERMRWIEAFTPQNQGDSDDKIYESWGKCVYVYVFILSDLSDFLYMR